MVDEVTGARTRRLHAHPGSGRTVVSVSPGGRYVISVGSHDRQCNIWDCFGDLHMAHPVNDVNLNMAYPVHDGTGDCVCDGEDYHMPMCPYMRTDGLLVAKFSPCGRWFAVAGESGDLWMWDMKYKVMKVVHTNSKELTDISFSGDGNFLCCGGFESQRHIVNVVSGTVTKTWDGEEGGCLCPTNNNLLTTACGYYLTLWDIENETKIWQIHSSNGEDGQYENFAIFSPDGLLIATSDVHEYPYQSDEEEDDGESNSDPVHVSVVDTATGNSRFKLYHTRGAVIRDAAFSACGDKLVTVEELIPDGGTCRMWDMSNGDLLWSTTHDHAIYSVDWGRDYLRDEMCIAFAMGGIARLGERSRVLPLDDEVVRMILNGD